MLQPDAFKAVMASFPTGVSVVTTRGRDGVMRGLTCSAVSSVSLDPPMLLVCIGKSSSTLPHLLATGTYVVNFLAEHAGEVAYRFASRATDKFAGLSLRPEAAADGAPILADHVVAHAACRTEQVMEAGDHVVIIGRVLDGHATPALTPLVHVRGKLGRLSEARPRAA